MRQGKKMGSYSAERKEKALAEEVADFVLRILPLPGLADLRHVHQLNRITPNFCRAVFENTVVINIQDVVPRQERSEVDVGIWKL